MEASDRAKALCADCISRRKLLDKFEPWLEVHDYNDGERNVIKAVLYEIKCMPPATGNNVATTDCISRQAVIDAFNTELNKLIVGGEVNARAVENYLNGVIDKIRYLPPAEPKTGKWENIADGIEYTCGTCDTCGARIPMAYKYYEYCPHCGTKNEVEHDG